MCKIYMLLGKSGSGKDTLYKELLECLPQLQPIVTYTTRDMRKGEEEGVEYFFKDESHLLECQEKGIVIESRMYPHTNGDVFYYTVDDGQIDIFSDKEYLVIGTLDTYESYKEYCGEESLYPILVNVPEFQRLFRSMDRERKEKKPNTIELCRRLVSDNEEFNYERLRAIDKLLVIWNDNLSKAILQLVKYFKGDNQAELYSIKDVTEDELLYEVK